MIAPQTATMMLPFGTLNQNLNNNNNNQHNFSHGQQYNTFSYQQSSRQQQTNLRPSNINTTSSFSRSYSALNSNDVFLSSNRQHQQQQQQNSFKLLNEDASEILSLVITGGPKWGFRIKQLNDNRVIVSRIDKGPAEKCGLKVNDEILSVNNVPLGDGPRSLLLNDYPADGTQGAASGSPGSQVVVGSQQNEASATPGPTGTTGTATGTRNDSNKSESSPLELATNSQKQSIGDGQLFLGAHRLELSKLDFTYQLIRHSSASNKLLLTVKRYLNPAYARASVAAANLMGQAQQISSEQFIGSQVNESSLNQYQNNQNQQQQQQEYMSNQENQFAQPPRSKRPHTALGVYHAYKCCECYCQREGKLIISILSFHFYLTNLIVKIVCSLLVCALVS